MALLSPQHSRNPSCLPFRRARHISFKSFLSQKKQRSFPSPKIKETFSCHDGSIWVIKESPDGKFIVTGEEEGFITLFSFEQTTKSIQPILCFPAHTSDITDITWSSDSTILATSSFDKQVKVWDIQKQKLIQTFEHQAPVVAISFNPVDKNHLLTCSLDLTAIVWNLETNTKEMKFCFPSHPVACAFSPDGKTIAIGSLNGLVSIISTQSPSSIKRFSTNKQQAKVSSIEFTPSGLFVSTNDSKLRLYSLEDFSLICTYQGHSTGDGMPRLSVSKDSKYILTPSQNRASVIIWPIDHKNEYQKTTIISKYKDNLSKTYEGFNFGNTDVSAAAFLSNNKNSMSMLVGTTDGTLYFVCS